MARKTYELDDDDEVPLSSFMDEFGIKIEDFDVLKLRITVERGTECYSGDGAPTYVEIQYDEPKPVSEEQAFPKRAVALKQQQAAVEIESTAAWKIRHEKQRWKNIKDSISILFSDEIDDDAEIQDIEVVE